MNANAITLARELGRKAAALPALLQRQPLPFPGRDRAVRGPDPLPAVAPAVRNDLVELVAENFRTEEINEMGRLVLGRFDSNAAAGAKSNVTLSSRKSARLLVECCGQGMELASLIKLVVDLDGGVIRGRPVRLEGLDTFLLRLARTGLHFDFRTRRVVSTRNPAGLADWGCLREGRTYEITVASLDCMGSARLVEENGTRSMERLYGALWSFCVQKLSLYGGRVWSWAGDGGVMAFAFRDHAQRGVQWAVDVQVSMPVFNLSYGDRFTGTLALRLALDTGRMRFLLDTGKIVSDAINFAAHLQKQATEPGAVSVSRRTWEALGDRHRPLFCRPGSLEEREYRCTRRLDSLA